MSETKIQKRFIDAGFGFPVHLENVPMVKVRGVWTSKINYQQLAETVLQSLVVKPARLTGSEVKFIRHSFELTLKEFAELFYVTHPAVIKWEKQQDKSTKMNWSVEKDIRMHIASKQDADQLAAVYEKLRKQFPEKKTNTKIDVNEKEELVAA